jgi:tetratricopeptide (TPR) repeat protein
MPCRSRDRWVTVPAMNTLRRFNGVRWESCVAWLTALLLAGFWTGCRPRDGAGKQEDQNIRTGKTYLDAGLYDEAEKAFQRALQNNPNSAEAHWQLGVFYYQDRIDYVGALYHLSRYAKLPQAKNRDHVNRMLEICRQEIAKGMPMTSIDRDQRSKIEHLERTNASLRTEIERLRQAALATTASPTRPGGEGSTPPPRETVTPREASRPPPSTPGQLVTRGTVGSPQRTHRIRAGETFHSVARDHQLDPQRVIAANPSIDPHNLQIGQVIRLPNP